MLSWDDYTDDTAPLTQTLNQSALDSLRTSASDITPEPSPHKDVAQETGAVNEPLATYNAEKK
jgi:hypothetical protein